MRRGKIGAQSHFADPPRGGLAMRVEPLQQAGGLSRRGGGGLRVMPAAALECLIIPIMLRAALAITMG